MIIIAGTRDRIEDADKDDCEIEVESQKMEAMRDRAPCIRDGDDC